MATALRSDQSPYHVQLSDNFDDGYRRALRSEVVGALDSGHQHVVVDCFAWNRLDLGVLSALIQCAKACARRGVGFEVVNLTRQIRLDIEALRLDDRLGLRS